MIVTSTIEPQADPRFGLVQTSISDWIAGHARTQPDSDAFVDGERRVTWAAFDQRVSHVAAALQGMGVRRGDKVALLASNSIEAVEILFGTLRAGAVIVPLSGLLTPEILARLVDDADAGVLFVDATHAPHVAPLRTALRPRVALVPIGFSEQGLPDYRTVLDGSPVGPAPEASAPDDDCNIIYSSGTTGVPKGIVHSHFARGLFAFGLSVRLRMEGRVVTVLTTPLFTNGTWMTLLPTVGVGGTCVLMRGFSATSFLDLVERERCTHAFMVPTQFTAVLTEPSLDSRDLSSLRILVTSGSRMEPQTKAEIRTRMTRGLMELYGMTEGVATALEPEDMAAKLGSVGRAIEGTEIRIIDDDGKEVPRGQPGEIIGYSPAVMRGYHKRPRETEAIVWQAEDGRSFLRTGDIGKLDEDGFLYVLDRKKDMIVSGGVNVYAADLEEVFGKHPDVAEVAAIAVPDPKWGETPFVLVVPRAGASAEADAIRAWGNERLGKHQRASRVELRAALPRNALGKVMKRELRAPYWADAVERGA